MLRIKCRSGPGQRCRVSDQVHLSEAEDDELALARAPLQQYSICPAVKDVFKEVGVAVVVAGE